MGRRGGGRWGEAEDEAFLKALAALGHVRRAAEAIGWTTPTVYERRRRCAAFAARWAKLAERPPLELPPELTQPAPAPAAAPAKPAQARPERTHPPRLVTRPHRVGKGGAVRPMRVRVVRQWTDAVEEEFFDLLASTCNVRLSARAIGFHTEGIYRRRRENPAFHKRWQAALAQGYARLEMEFLRAAAEAVEGIEFEERPIGPISADAVLRLLALHRNEVKGQGPRPGSRPVLPSIEQVKAEILRRAAAIRAARGQGGAPPLEPPAPE